MSGMVLKRALACVHTVMYVSSIHLHLKRLWSNQNLSVLPKGTTVHIISKLLFDRNMKRTCWLRKFREVSSLSVVVEIVDHENWKQWWDILKLSCTYRSRTRQSSWFGKPFHGVTHRRLRVLVLAVKMHFPSQPDTGRSDIIIYGQSCWQRNANIDLEAQSVTKLLSSLSHEAQWCLYGNFMRPLKQDIGHWNVIFTAALFHNLPQQVMDVWQWKTCTNCMCTFPLCLSKGEGLVGGHVCAILPQKCYRPCVLHVFTAAV